jgi:RHS repeat-associated protein
MRKTPCYNEFAICIKIGSAIDIDNQKYTIVINPFHLTSHLRTQTHILPYWSNVSKPAQNASFEHLEIIDNQHPFGGCFASSSTGKERDEETGYGYFGARYMDHELMTMWLSVDPMADKYPSISPYAYCAWNPVKLVDPNGKECLENEDPYLLFNGATNKLQIWDDNNTPDDKLDDIFLGQYDAHNNVDIKKSKGKWEDGEYEMETQKAIPREDPVLPPPISSEIPGLKIS